MFSFGADHQFAITAKAPDILDGELIESQITLDDLTFRVNDGTLKWHGTYYNFQHQDIEMADDEENHIYVSFYPNTSGTLSAFASDQILSRYDTDEGCYNVQIGSINSSSGVIYIEQYIKGFISLDEDMVSVGAVDQIPDYLPNKFVFNEPRYLISGQTGLFGCNVVSSQVSGAGGSVFTYNQLDLTFLWDNVLGYQPLVNKEPQFLMHYYNENLGAQGVGWHTYEGGGGSTSGEYNFNVSGSLADFITITTQKQGDKTNVKLTFKPQSIDPQPDKDIILIKDDEGNLTYKTGTNVMYYFDDQGILTTFDLRTDGIVYIQDGVPHVLNNGAGIVMTDEDGVPYIKSLSNLEGLLTVDQNGQLGSIAANQSDDLQLLASDAGQIYWIDTAECGQTPQE